jgi:NADH-quinone oxidoreductase subunit M
MELTGLLIPLIVVLPAFAAAALLLPVAVFDDRRSVWAFSVVSAVTTFVLSLILFAAFDWSDGTIQFQAAIPWVTAFGLEFAWGVDGISLWLVLLSTFLMPVVLLVCNDQAGDRPRAFYGWLLLCQSAMTAAFVATDVLFFFLCFEFTLIPMFFLIGQFGGSDRVAAARLFFIYTFAGSMLTFAGLLYVAWFAAGINGFWSFHFETLFIAAQQMTFEQQAWVLVSLLAGFAVKVPIFPLHTWLPMTYVEAPFAATIVLSSVLAKLGTYALIRFALPLCPEAVAHFAPLIGVFAVIGIVYAAMICCVQRDAKKLIAYASISHLGLCTLGLIALDRENLGAVGGVLYMVNHGLATGALFLCIAILFNRFRTTDMGEVSGVVQAMPAWAFFTVFFTMASVGLPGLNGFVSEFVALLGVFIATQTLGPAYAIVAGLTLILGAVYMLYMVGKVVFGPVKAPAGVAVRDLNGRELAGLIPLAIVCVGIGLYPTPVLRSLQPPVERMTVAAKAAVEAQSVALEVQASTDAGRSVAFDAPSAHLPGPGEGETWK